jgi:hypothetical protein
MSDSRPSESDGESLLQRALAALVEPSSDDVERQLTGIITSIEERYGENQKEVAAELQRLAREIENNGQGSEAIEFKQRTTEIMLRLSMERRRGLRQQAGSTVSNLAAMPNGSATSHSAPPPASHISASHTSTSHTSHTSHTSAPVAANNNPRTTRANIGALSPQSAEAILARGAGGHLFDSIHYVVQSSTRFETELHFYMDVLLGKQTWHSDDPHRRAAAIKLANGPELILVESQIPAPSLNVYLVTAPGAAREKLESYGFMKRGELKTPHGQALIFSGPDGNTLAIIASSGKIS